MTKGRKKHGFPKFAVIMTVGLCICLFFAVVYFMAYFNFEAAASEGIQDFLGRFGLISDFAEAGSEFLGYAIYLTIGALIFGILAIIFWKRRI
jgi:hypothetical protein